MAVKIRVLVVDDHALLRAGIAALLKNERNIVVVGEASNGADAIEKVKSLRPHIVLMDLSMPGMDGIDSTEKIVRGNPQTKVLALTQHEHEEYIKQMLRAGASGYLLKNSLTADLLNAIRAVAKGEKFFTPSVSKILLDTVVKSASDHMQGETLTKREREILQFIADGHTNPQIGDTLGISVRTVEFHRANLIAKLGVRDTASLVKYAIKQNIITLKP